MFYFQLGLITLPWPETISVRVIIFNLFSNVMDQKDLNKHKISIAQGLQIDNLVYNRNREVHAIRASDFLRFRTPNIAGDYGLYGIPLNKRVLRAAEFISDEGGTEYSIFLPINNGPEMFVEDAGDTYFPVGIKDAKGHVYFRDIKYLHQLQNLFYSITGRELVINDFIFRLTAE